MRTITLRQTQFILTWLIALTSPAGGAWAADLPSTAVRTDADSSIPRLPGAGNDDQIKKLTEWRRAAVAAPKMTETQSRHSKGHVAAPLFVSSGYGWRYDPFGRGARRHAGIDLPGRLGSPVYATGAGVVSFAGRAGGYGNLVQIDHPGGLTTRYGHLSHILVAEGSTVSKREVIGLMGSTGRSTGSHLHYEVRVGGAPVNPLGFIGSINSFVPHYDVAWTPPRKVMPRWTGWDLSRSDSHLPEASVP